jgi:RNA polymerase sigma-70 factor (ECF subfamily)
LTTGPTESSSAVTASRILDLAARARSGDRDAFEALFARGADRLHAYVRARLGPKLRSEVDSMDVLQETFIDAQRAVARFEPQGAGALLAWLCRIAESRIKALADRQGAAKRRPPGTALPVEEALDRARASGTGPQTGAARAEAQRRIERALDVLEDDERRAVLARFFEDRTIDETAAIVGRSATATRRLLGRALLRLGRELPEGFA